MDGLGKDRNAALGIPAEDDLCRRLAVPGTNLSQQRILEDPVLSFGERRPGVIGIVARSLTCGSC